MLIALVSASSRAGLNIIDRYQIGLQGRSIILVNFWNNAIPAVVMLALAEALDLRREVCAAIFDIRTILFSGLVQLTAYAYSHAFRRLTVNQVAVAGKAADLFIPIGVFLVVGHWDWLTYCFAVATTFACLPMLRGSEPGQPMAMNKAAITFIATALVLQASFAPLLAAADQTTSDMQNILAFATAVIFWRMLWSVLLMSRIGDRQPLLSAWSLLLSPLFIGRTMLSVITQITFVLAASSPAAAIAWPILNSTGLLAMLLSSLLLREKPTALEAWTMAAITGLALLRFFSL